MRHQVSTSRKERALTIAQVGVSLLCGYFVLYSITDGDLFWHLAAGREIVRRKAFLFNDPFSYTAAFARWIDVHWLYQVGVYLVEQIGGLRLLLPLKMYAVSGAVLLVFSSYKKNGATLVIWLITGIIIYFQRYLIPMRPILVSLLCMGAVIALIERYNATGKWRFWVIVPVVQIVWANSQGLFLLGPAMAAAFGAGGLADRLLGRRFSRFFSDRAEMPPRRLFLLLVLPALLAVVSLVNPYGWRALVFAVRLFIRLDPSADNIYSKMIVENMPLPSMVGTPYMPYVAAVAAMCLLLLLSVIGARRSVRVGHCLLAGAGFVLAWMAQRNGIIFTFMALPALLWNSGNCNFALSNKAVKPLRALVVAAVVAVTGAAVVNHTRMLRWWPHTFSPFTYPTQTTALLAKLPPEGNLFNADRYGGYLIWKLFPGRQVSSDTRLTMRTGAFFREYLSLVGQPELFDAYARRWSIGYVVLPVAPMDQYLPLAASLYRNPRWRLVFTDGAEVLFSSDSLHGMPVDLNTDGTIEAIDRSLQERYGGSPQVLDEARMYLGRWCAFAGASDGAMKVLRGCGRPDAKLLLAGIIEQTGAGDEAENILRLLVAQFPGKSDVRLSLAMLYLRRGHREDGLRQLEILLEKDPFNKHARNVLFKLSRKQKE